VPASHPPEFRRRAVELARAGHTPHWSNFSDTGHPVGADAQVRPYHLQLATSRNVLRRQPNNSISEARHGARVTIDASDQVRRFAECLRSN